MKGSGRRYIEGENSMQGSLVPWNLDDQIEAENPVRFIHLFVKALDLKELGFVRAKAGPDGRVTCPIGRELFLYRERKYGKVYASREACRTCPNGKGHKTVKFGPETVYVPVIMYGRSRSAAQSV